MPRYDAISITDRTVWLTQANRPTDPGATWDDGAPDTDTYDAEGVYDESLVRTDRDGFRHRRFFFTDAGMASATNLAFSFLRGNAEGRYSDRTLMTINRMADRATAYQRDPAATYLDGILPMAFIIDKEASYDEDTEVKHGGAIAVAVTLPSESGSRIVLAVNRNRRREGWGRKLMTLVVDYVSNPISWVGTGNVVGQHFLLEAGMRPRAMNSNGTSMLYSFGSIPESEGVAL